MKTFLFLLLMLAVGNLRAITFIKGPEDVDADIGPATSSSNVTIAAPGADERNCLTSIDVTALNHAGAGFAVRILSGATTTYFVTQSTGAVRQTWGVNDAFCADLNTALYINVSSATVPMINYKGFQKKR